MPELIDVVPGSPEWLAARRLGVTATDIVTIIGLSAWDSVYGLFWKKLGQVPDEPERDRWELGKALEPYITERWANTGSNWKDYVRWPGGLYRHSGRTWQMATPDRILGPFNDLSPEISPPVGTLELKSWADADRKRWEDGPPAVVRAQVLWQMDVMDAAAGHVGVVFLPSGEFRSYTIAHEDEKTHDELGWTAQRPLWRRCAPGSPASPTSRRRWMTRSGRCSIRRATRSATGRRRSAAMKASCGSRRVRRRCCASTVSRWPGGSSATRR